MEMMKMIIVVMKIMILFIMMLTVMMILMMVMIMIVMIMMIIISIIMIIIMIMLVMMIMIDIVIIMMSMKTISAIIIFFQVSNLLSKRTMEALRSYRTSLCWTTTYMNTYKDPHGEKRANAKKRTKTNVNSSQVNRPANESKSSKDHDIAKERTRRSSDVACVKKPRICGYCYKRKGKISGIKIENENRKMDCSTLPKEIGRNVLPSKNEEMQKRVTWPVAQKDMRGSKPTNTDITIGGYNDRLKCPVLSSPFCKCDVKSQALKESMRKANALARRRAASFDKRNFTTISVFHLLKHDPVAAQRQLFHKDRTSDTFMKKPYCSDWNIDYRSDAVRQFYEKFPEGTPVLNNYSKT